MPKKAKCSRNLLGMFTCSFFLARAIKGPMLQKRHREGHYMPGKAQKDLFRTLQEYDQQIRKLGMDRFLSGQQIYNSKTHRLQPRYAELTKFQLRGILLWALHYASNNHQRMKLYAQEKRLLSRVFSDPDRLMG